MANAVRDLQRYVAQAVDDYNNRPYTALNGLTPNEVINGQHPALVNLTQETRKATARRIQENKLAKCCSYSF